MSEERELSGYEAESAAKQAAIEKLAATLPEDHPFEVPEPAEFPAPPEDETGRTIHAPDPQDNATEPDPEYDY